MKQIYFLITCLLLMAAAHAEKSPRAKSVKIAAQGSVQMKFSNLAPASEHKDSVLIIFDRYNHTGAGVIYQVYSADQDQNIVIEGVPVGKYYVTIQGLGIHRDRQEMVVKVSEGKSGKLTISLKDSEEFVKEKVVIPAFTPNFEELAVLKSK
jgi:hypothetical protein